MSMYEQVSHSLLNDILIALEPDIKEKNLQHFYIRLGANFYAIYSLFHQLYGHRDDFKEKLRALVRTLTLSYIARSQQLRKLDFVREKDHNWFLSQRWVGVRCIARNSQVILTVAEKITLPAGFGHQPVTHYAHSRLPERQERRGVCGKGFQEDKCRCGVLLAIWMILSGTSRSVECC